MIRESDHPKTELPWPVQVEDEFRYSCKPKNICVKNMCHKLLENDILKCSDKSNVNCQAIEVQNQMIKTNEYDRLNRSMPSHLIKGLITTNNDRSQINRNKFVDTNQPIEPSINIQQQEIQNLNIKKHSKLQSFNQKFKNIGNVNNQIQKIQKIKDSKMRSIQKSASNVGEEIQTEMNKNVDNRYKLCTNSKKSFRNCHDRHQGLSEKVHDDYKTIHASESSFNKDTFASQNPLDQSAHRTQIQKSGSTFATDNISHTGGNKSEFNRMAPPLKVSDNFTTVDMSPNVNDQSTTMKTPRYNHFKNQSLRHGYDFGQHDDSQSKNKTGTGFYDLSQVSPFSQKLSMFSATVNSNNMLVGGSQTQTSNQGHLQASVIKRPAAQGQNGQGSFDVLADQGVSAFNQAINPYVSCFDNIRRPISHPKERTMVFSQSGGQNDEEDFQIKPQNIYGNLNIPSNYFENLQNEQMINLEHKQIQMMHQNYQSYHQELYQMYMDYYMKQLTQMMLIRTCPEHGEGFICKQSLQIMQQQVYDYANSCLLHFQYMEKTAKTLEEKQYYQNQQSILMSKGAFGPPSSSSRMSAQLSPFAPHHPKFMPFFPHMMNPFMKMDSMMKSFGGQSHSHSHSNLSTSHHKQSDANSDNMPEKKIEVPAGPLPIHHQTSFGFAGQGQQQFDTRVKEEGQGQGQGQGHRFDQNENEHYRCQKTNVDNLKEKSNQGKQYVDHSQSYEKQICQNHQSNDLFDDDNCPFIQTTGDKDRKRRNFLKPFMMSANQEKQCPKIANFCPDNHTQDFQKDTSRIASIFNQNAMKPSLVNEGHHHSNSQDGSSIPCSGGAHSRTYHSMNARDFYYNSNSDNSQFAVPYNVHASHQVNNQNSNVKSLNLKNQSDQDQAAADKKKRNRKNPNQMQYLVQEFAKDPNWTKETCLKVSQATGLTEAQVYKWGWDQKNKKPDDGSKQLQQQANTQIIMQHLQKNHEIWQNQNKQELSHSFLSESKQQIRRLDMNHDKKMKVGGASGCKQGSNQIDFIDSEVNLSPRQATQLYNRKDNCSWSGDEEATKHISYHQNGNDNKMIFNVVQKSSNSGVIASSESMKSCEMQLIDTQHQILTSRFDCQQQQNHELGQIDNYQKQLKTSGDKNYRQNQIDKLQDNNKNTTQMVTRNCSIRNQSHNSNRGHGCNENQQQQNNLSEAIANTVIEMNEIKQLNSQKSPIDESFECKEENNQSCQGKTGQVLTSQGEKIPNQSTSIKCLKSNFGMMTRSRNNTPHKIENAKDDKENQQNHPKAISNEKRLLSKRSYKQTPSHLHENNTDHHRKKRDQKTLKKGGNMNNGNNQNNSQTIIQDIKVGINQKMRSNGSNSQSHQHNNQNVKAVR